MGREREGWGSCTDQNCVVSFGVSPYMVRWLLA